MDVYVLQVYLPQVHWANLVLQPLLWVLCAAAFLVGTVATYRTDEGADWLTGYYVMLYYTILYYNLLYYTMQCYSIL